MTGLHHLINDLKNDMIPKLDSVKCVCVGVLQHLVLVSENQLPKAEGDMKLKQVLIDLRVQSVTMDSWLPWLVSSKSKKFMLCSRQV